MFVGTLFLSSPDCQKANERTLDMFYTHCFKNHALANLANIIGLNVALVSIVCKLFPSDCKIFYGFLSLNLYSNSTFTELIFRLTITLHSVWAWEVT